MSVIQEHPAWLWGWPHLLSDGYYKLFLWGKPTDVQSLPFHSVQNRVWEWVELYLQYHSVPSWHEQTTFIITEHMQNSMWSTWPFKLLDCCNTTGDELFYPCKSYLQCMRILPSNSGATDSWKPAFAQSSAFSCVHCSALCPRRSAQTYTNRTWKQDLVLKLCTYNNMNYSSSLKKYVKIIWLLIKGNLSTQYPNETNVLTKRLTCFEFLSQFLLQVFRQSLLLPPSLCSQNIVSQLTRPNKPFNMFRLSFTIPSSGCFDKLPYFLRHCIPRT